MILTKISLKRPVFATVLIVALVVLGMVSYRSLSVDEWPDVDMPYVSVIVNYRGAAPEQVDTKITQKVEEAVSSISGVKHISSTAREGVSTTTIEFSLETSPAVAAQDVRDKLGTIRAQLPQDADDPMIMRFDPSSMPIMSIVVSGNQSVQQLTTLVDDVVKRRLESINGVGTVNVQGELARQIHIDLDKSQLAAYGLTIPEVMDSLRNENMEVPGGKLNNGDREMSLRTMGSYDVAQKFLDAPVGRRDGVQLDVRNIGMVADSFAEPTSITKLNGQQAIGLDIMKQSGVNTVQLADDIKATLTNLQQQLPAGVQLTIVRDNSKSIRDSVGDVEFNLVLGGVLAVAIVFLFLGNWRSTMISAIAIPTSIISTFFVMKLLNFTINSMSLLALSLAVGLLIDDAIVVIENIVRHMEMGKSKEAAADEGTDEIGLAVTATTMALIAVFVPVGMMNGIVGQFFKQFGITVAFSVLVSLFVAFTLTPMLSAKFLNVGDHHSVNPLTRGLNRFNNWFDRLASQYTWFLERALNHRKKVLTAAVVLFIASLGLVSFLGSNFMTKTDTGEFTVWADLDPGTSIDGAQKLAERVTQVLKDEPEVRMTYSTANINRVTVFASIGDKHQRSRSMEAVMADLRVKLQEIPGVRISVVQKSAMSESKNVQLMIRGPSLDVLGDLAPKVQAALQKTAGAVDVTSSYQPGRPDIQLTVNSQKAADLGVSTASIADTISTMFNGVTVSQFNDGDDRYDVVVRLQADDRKQLSDLNGIYLPSKNKDSRGQSIMVPLSQVTTTTYSTSPSEVTRYDRQRDISLTANLSGTTLGQFNREFQSNLSSTAIPAGYSVVSAGESERMKDAFASILIALFLAVAFIFFVLAAQFESYIDPFAIMLSLPLAIIGAILGLLVMHSDLSMMSLIGIIMLMGLVTKNAILVIDFAKQRIAQGMETKQALVEATRIRMRPIIMTTAAMVFGMLPMAIGFGPGAEGRAPMAHAIIGGLLTSTLLTLVVVPVVYSLIDDFKRNRAARKQQMIDHQI